MMNGRFITAFCLLALGSLHVPAQAHAQKLTPFLHSAHVSDSEIVHAFRLLWSDTLGRDLGVDLNPYGTRFFNILGKSDTQIFTAPRFSYVIQRIPYLIDTQNPLNHPIDITTVTRSLESFIVRLSPAERISLVTSAVSSLNSGQKNTVWRMAIHQHILSHLLLYPETYTPDLEAYYLQSLNIEDDPVCFAQVIHGVKTIYRWYVEQAQVEETNTEQVQIGIPLAQAFQKKRRDFYEKIMKWALDTTLTTTGNDSANKVSNACWLLQEGVNLSSDPHRFIVDPIHNAQTHYNLLKSFVQPGSRRYLQNPRLRQNVYQALAYHGPAFQDRLFTLAQSSNAEERQAAFKGLEVRWWYQDYEGRNTMADRMNDIMLDQSLAPEIRLDFEAFLEMLRD